ncbi:MAG: amidohydrolase [Ignavibacteriales bacterium]|nr:amidohydrolase [Ignavibacteriales bacterium]MCB9258441.1 amidohydrolase [Ignavibacteriales bacterium]
MKFGKYISLPFLIITIFFLITLLTSCSDKNQTADLILLNGKIITVDSKNTIAEALAISKDTIMAIGTRKEIENFISDSTTILDLKGKTAIPGIIESHAHLIGTGNAKINLNLRDAKNWDEVVYLVSTAADNAKFGEWIIGRGWHQEKWDPVPLENVNGYPLHTALSDATPNNPVMLSHASGHAIFANAKAMALANITSETPDPFGGKIIKDEKGNPIGVFMEDAERLISEQYEKYLKSKSYNEQKEDKKKAIRLAIDECLSNGITSFHDAGASFEDIRIIKEMVDNNEIKIRLYEMLLEDYQSLKDSLRQYQTVGYGNNNLTVQAIKLYMDGALGSRGAWLLSPYDDSPDQIGLNVTSTNIIRKIAALAAENDFQICTHAIGDRANRITLDIYEETFNKHANHNSFRWRIEHAQHISERDIPRFAELGVIAAMQSIHCTSDAPFVVKRLGEYRAKTGAYAWQSLVKNSAIICNGTDSPVEDINPIANFYAAVTRKTNNGEIFYGEQKLSPLDALKTLTINGAYAAFEENIKGSIEVGKLADITILSNDLLTIPDDEILNTVVNFTIVGGKILYER